MPLIIDNETVERFALQLHKARNIVIASHQNPDGDAVGSALAFKHWLEGSFFVGETTPQITIVLPHHCPHDATYLPGTDQLLDASAEYDRCVESIMKADLFIGVDFNVASRITPLDKALESCGATKLLVDHHHNPDTTLFDVVLSVPDLSSTCELLYWLFVHIIGEGSITDTTAQCLYHGINTDTGCFAYANEDSTLYEATAALMRHPLNASAVHNQIFNSYSVVKMRLLGHLISQKLKIFEKEGFAYIAINDTELAELGATADDLEGLVNYTLMMEPIKVGALVKMSEEKVRISFRSKEDFDVNKFANRYFGGGGHTKASGATSPYDFDTSVRLMEEKILEELRK